MKTIIDFIKKHPVLTYYILAFAISTGGIFLLVGGLSGIPATAEQFERLLPMVIPVQLSGPSVAGLLLTGLVSGRAGFRDLFSRLLRWRVAARWYAVALLAAPLVFTVVQLALSLTSPVFLPGLVTTDNKVTFLVSGLVGALVVGILEELGWTGFALPRLRSRFGILATGLIMGVLWGAWHLLPHDIWAARISAGELPLITYAIVNGIGLLVGQLLAFRVLMVWVYERTGSLLVAMLMHVSLTASTFILSALSISGMSLLINGLVLAVAWWVIVAAVVAANRWQLAQKSLQSRVA